MRDIARRARRAKCLGNSDLRWWFPRLPRRPSGPGLAQAVGPEQSSRVGNQTGGRVFLFLHTDDFWRDFEAYRSRGVVFVREPSEESYGIVAVFKDLYGNLWDLLQLKTP